MELAKLVVLLVTYMPLGYVGAYTEIHTPGANGPYQWLPVTLSKGPGSMTFDVRAPADAFVSLSQDRKFTRDSYGVMLGAFGNLKACLNEGWVVCKTEHVERGVLHPGQFRSFWVTWEDGLVQFGKGCTVGRHWVLQYQFPKRHDVIYVGIRTTGQPGTWRFGPGGCSGNFGTGGASLPDQAGGLTLTTPDSGTYKTAIINMDPARHTYLQFEVDAGHDVGLVLAAGNGANLFQFEHYIVELGRHGNRESCIYRSKRNGCVASSQTNNVLKKGTMNKFWITFKKGLIEVGRGPKYDTWWRVRMLHFEDPNPIGVMSIGIRTFMGATGTWKINGITSAPVLPANRCPPPQPLPKVPCPDRWSGLIPWSAGNQPGLDVIIEGRQYIMTGSSYINTLVIKNGGKLIFKDNGEKKLVLRTRSILIQDGGELHIGSERCRYKGQAEIQLVGKTTDSARYEHPSHGRKYVAVEEGGTLEVHGQEKVAWTKLQGTLRKGTNNPKIRLADDVTSWRVGDKIVIATTDFSLDQSEDYEVAPCGDCGPHELRLKGQVRYDHYGEVYRGVDMRAEVGLLTRNVAIRGVMEPQCYGSHMTPNYCRFFKFDTFGGHMIFYRGFKNVHLSGLEVTNMGQQIKARYPIHFHMCDDVDEVGCYDRPAYVKGVSIHHCFDRCVTIHGTDGLLVQDTVGYETLGHCYFLEDGGEQRNVLDHNLGLNTRYGTVEPSDRNSDMCRNILTWVWPGYVPDPNNCNAVSTFWISHPNNTFTNNAAVGSQNTGYWYIFRDAPSGPSEGKLPRGHISRSTIGRFHNNKATGHPRAGLMIDFGVKTSPASARSPAEPLAIGAGHFKPTTPAILSGLTATKCDQGAWTRGGTIVMEDSRFADNIVGLTFASAGEMTVDGEHSIARRTVFVGRSPNRGTNGHFQRRTVSGFRIYDGPVGIDQSTFADFVSSGDRYDRTHAISFFGGPFQMTPKNQMNRLSFDSKSVRFRSSSRITRDAEKTEIFWDRDGSTTGYRDAYVINDQNYINRHEGCKARPELGTLVCGGKHASLYIRKGGPTTLVRDEYPSHPMSLKGFGNVMHTVMLATSYTLHFQGASPAEVIIKMVNFDMSDWVRIGVCFPVGGTFDVYYETAYRNDVTRKMWHVNSAVQVEHGDGLQYYYDHAARLLFVKPQSRMRRTGWWYYPEGYGTEQIRIKPHSPGGHGDCRGSAYPRYARAPRGIDLTPGGCGENCGAPLGA